MTEITEKSYAPKKFRRKIPKVSRHYNRNKNEPKSFDKSEEDLEMEKSLVNELLTEVLEKGKKYPIGTVHNGYKKIAEGRWEKDTNGSKPGGKVQVSDKHKATMDKQNSGRKAKEEEHDRVGLIWENALNDNEFESTGMEGLSDEMQDALKQLNSTVKTLHSVKEDDEDYDSIEEAMEEANDAVQPLFNDHMSDFKPDVNKDTKEKAKTKYQGDPAAEDEDAGKDNEAARAKEGKSPEEGGDAGKEDALKDKEYNNLMYWLEVTEGGEDQFSTKELERELKEGRLRHLSDDIKNQFKEVHETHTERNRDPELTEESPSNIKASDISNKLEESINQFIENFTPEMALNNVKKSNIQETNMSDINKEMDAMADKLEKSNDPKEILRNTVRTLGSDGLKKAMPSLDTEQKELLIEVLEELKVEKALAMDDVYAGTKKFVTINKLGVEVENRSDDADEKLVKPEANEHPHQGDLTPEGREDHVIKSIDETIDDLLKSEEYEMPKKEAINEHKRLVNVLDSKDQKDDKEESKKQKKELKEMKKSKEDLIVLKDEIIKSYEDAGLSYTEELVKGEMKKRLLKEESQVEPTDQTKGGKKDKADKPSVPEIEVGKDADETADEVKMKKSISYDHPNKRLEAYTGGRNHNFSINGYYDEALRKATLEGKEVETLEKSEGMEDGINDLIEKGLDRDSDTCKTEELFKSQNKGENVAKSFGDDDMVDAMNMSKEEAAKVLGK